MLGATTLRTKVQLTICEKALSCDVVMLAVHFWGQERSYLPDQRVSYLWLKEKGRGNMSISPRINMDTQGKASPQKWTASITTSQDSAFAGGLSIKKA